MHEFVVDVASLQCNNRSHEGTRAMRVRQSALVGLTLVLCYLVAWLDRTAISLTLRTMSVDLDMGPDVQGWVVSSFFLGYALCQIPGGMLADRFGPRRVILGALAWWSV